MRHYPLGYRWRNGRHGRDASIRRSAQVEQGAAAYGAGAHVAQGAATYGAGAQVELASGATYVGAGAHTAPRLNQLHGQNGQSRAQQQPEAAGSIATASKVSIFFMVLSLLGKQRGNYCFGSVV